MLNRGIQNIKNEVKQGMEKFTNKYYGKPVEEYSKVIEELF